MFKRTDAGISAENKFYDSDYILYCEGSPDYVEDVLSPDELFWSKLFADFGIKVKCKSVGSKNNLKYFTNLIIRETPNILVAMDRDYDDFYGPMKEHKRIIRTFGYSFESDIAYLFDVKKVGNLFVNLRNNDIFEMKLDKFLESIEINIKRASIIDIKYFKSEIPLFNRRSPQSIIITQKKFPPSLNKKQFMKNVLKAKKEIPSNTSKPIFSKNYIGTQVFFGKTVLYMIWSFFQSFANNFRGSRSIHYDIFITFAIESMHCKSANNNVSNYYSEIFSNLKST